MKFLNCILPTSLVLLTLATPNLANQQVPKNQLVDNTQATLLASQKSQSTKPSTKKATLSVEGQKTSITLKLYENPNFSTYFPLEDFLAESSSSGEGQGVKFIANFSGKKNENAYVHVAFLNNFQKYSQVSKFVNSKNGLIASNKWRVVSRNKKTPYPWAKETIVFSQGKNNLGSIYIGEQKGKAFYVITHFPAEYGDGFVPRADLILRNLSVGS
jgi:hypothetical protein